MVSSTKQTNRRRRTRQNQRDRWNKVTIPATPVFPIHPEGYDQKAPDAKKAPQGS